LDNL